jgi:hypothetical protein
LRPASQSSFGPSTGNTRSDYDGIESVLCIGFNIQVHSIA